MLFLGTAIYAQLHGGFEFWDPVLMQIYRYGTWFALLGFACAALGLGRVRVAVMGIAGIMAVVWILAASGE
jgi:hypothetical protein